MHRLYKTSFLLILFMMVLILPLLAVSSVADWSSDELEQPIAVDGKIWHNEENSFSFTLNKAGIPIEPVVVNAKLSNKINSDTGTAEGDGVQLFDPEKIRFNTDGFTSYIGTKVTSISPDTTIYTENNSVFEGEGSNIDLIKGSTAQLFLKYNPSFTHQTGALWYCISDTSYTDFIAMPGSSVCTILGNEVTDLSGSEMSDNRPNLLPKTIRAISIFDPWFEKMEAKWGDEARRIYKDENPNATEEQVEAITWKSMYLKKSNHDHLYAGEIWRYPSKDEASIYTDYLVTVRSPIEMVTFTAKAEYAIGNSDFEAPQYLLFNDQLAHPDMTSTNRIWCYDTSDASAGTATVDAFRIETKIDPDYGYTLKFELVQGSAIGHLDFTELDGNVFRFVPKGEYIVDGEKRVNYGSVVIKATAEEVNFSKYFTLMYMPSNMKLVKYIGDDMKDWDKGVVIDPKTGVVNDAASGEWDVVKYEKDGKTITNLYGMECLVLYPGEVFNLGVIQMVEDRKTGKSTPYYMTDGVYTIDYNKPIYKEDGETIEGYEASVIKYAITYSVTRTNDPKNNIPLADVLAFESEDGQPFYGEIVNGFDPVVGGNTETLIPCTSNKGQSYWYKSNGQRIRALKEGTYYLHYTIAPIIEEGPNAGTVSMAESTLSGGINLFIVSPADQALTDVIGKQYTANKINAEIPYRISAGQRKNVVDADGNAMPSHWYLGNRGAIGYPISNKDDAKNIYYGCSYAIFSDAGFITDAYDKINLGMNITLKGIGGVDFGKRCFNIYEGAKGKPGTPQRALDEWGGVLAISQATATEEWKKSPNITDIKVTGMYGLAQYPKIQHLRIVDTATENNPEGLFTKANLIDSKDGKKVWDFRALNLISYEHANMGSTGELIDTFYTPSGMELFVLDSPKICENLNRDENVRIEGYTNNLGSRSTFEFIWGSNVKNTLKEIWLGYNAFRELELNDFLYLEGIFVNGDTNVNTRLLASPNRRLVVYNNPKLRVVYGDRTTFDTIMVKFPTSGLKGIENETLVANDGSFAEMATMLRANDSQYLRKINVAGHLVYLELLNDNALESVIGTNEFNKNNADSFVPSANYTDMTSSNRGSMLPEETGWIRTVNLGGQLFNSNKSLNQITGIDYNANPLLNQYNIPNSSSSSGSNNVKTLRFNYIYRFFSDHGDSGATSDVFYPNHTKTGLKGSLDTLEVFCLVPDSETPSNVASITKSNETHLTSANKYSSDLYIYNFDYRHGGKSTSNIRFHHVPAKASINFSGVQMQSMEILDFQGFLNLYGAPNINDLHINEEVSRAIGESVIELSRSGISNFTGVESFKGVDVMPSSIDFILPADGTPVVDTFTLSVRPGSMVDDTVITEVRVEDPSICDVSQGDVSSSGIVFNVKAKNVGTTKVYLRGVTKGYSWGGNNDVCVTVNVEAEEVASFDITLVGGKEEVIDGVEIMVLEYDTTSDSPLSLELKAFDKNLNEDVSIIHFMDFPENDTSEDNPFKDPDTGRIATYEEIYNQIETMAGFIVKWSFESTGHPGQEYAEIDLDSYSGNRVKIIPKIDNQEFKGNIKYVDTRYNIDYEAQFLVRVKNGAERRWELRTDPSTLPIQFSSTFTPVAATVWDKQLLTNGKPSAVPPSELTEPIQWSVEDTSIIKISPGDNAINNSSMVVLDLMPGTTKLIASYKGVVSSSISVIVNGVYIANPRLGTGEFEIIDLVNDDNIWDIAWAVDITAHMTTTEKFILDNSQIESGRIRFTTTNYDGQNRVYEFDIVKNQPGQYISFKVYPSYKDSFCYRDIFGSSNFMGFAWGSSQYNEKGEWGSIYKSAAMSILNKGTVEIVDLAFASKEKDLLHWGGNPINKIEPNHATGGGYSMRLAVKQNVQKESNHFEKVDYTQTFSSKSFYENTPMVSVDGEMAYINLKYKSVEDALELANEFRPKMLKAISRAPEPSISNDTTLINVRAYRMVINNCPYLTSINISKSDNKVTAEGLKILEGNGSKLSESSRRLRQINIDESSLSNITINNYGVETVVLNSSGLKEVNLAYNLITNCVADNSCSQLNYLKLDNNKLGNKNLKLGTWQVKTRFDCNHGINADWHHTVDLRPPRDSSGGLTWGLQNLKTLVLWGNDIWYLCYGGDMSGGGTDFYVRIGNEIPNNTPITRCYSNYGYNTACFPVWGNGYEGDLNIRGKVGNAICVEGMDASFTLDLTTDFWISEPTRGLRIYPFGQ